jgi:hypothetical protein
MPEETEDGRQDTSKEVQSSPWAHLAHQLLLEGIMRATVCVLQLAAQKSSLGTLHTRLC